LTPVSTPRFRVGLDVHALQRGPSGNRRYLEGILRGLASADGRMDYVLYHLAGGRELPHVVVPRSSIWRSVRPGAPLLRLAAGFRIASRRDALDVFHGQYFAPFLGKTPMIVTIHDLAYLDLWHLYSLRFVTLMRAGVAATVRRVRAIITDTEHSRRRIVEHYQLPPRRVVTVPIAVGREFRPQSDDELRRVRQRYALAEPYFLYVGRLDPRKNISGLIAAYRKLGVSTKPQLVIAGPTAPAFRMPDLLAGDSTLRRSVLFLGAVPDVDLPALYAGAVALVYPSFYEGFGLPPLEAMSCGTPVITSNVTSLPEVVGDAGILIDPSSVDEIADAMRSLADDAQLRRSLINAGLARAAQFSWERVGRSLESIYERVAVGREPI
jgi:glycosyltransferase involved in cell wall biosynthesis